jgi:hypothetical protein
MRGRWVVAVLIVVTLLPKSGRAQVYQFATPAPQVTATASPWQIDNQPISVQGIVYYPTAFVRPFDGNVMTQVGYFDRVPIYADKTLEPFSIVYVPVARGMRSYERARVGEMAGTTGSQAPTLPVQPVSAVATEQPVAGGCVVGTRGAAVPTATDRALPVTVMPRPAATHVETVPRPRATDGVWIRYDGAKWYSDGAAVPFTSDRFTKVGTYRGFPVYRERGNAHEIWVTVVQDGPVAPYVKR